MVLAIACLAVGCARRQFTVTTGPSRASQLAALPPQPASALLLPDRSGVSPSDTVVRFAAVAGRRVMMRHAAPDNAVFAIVDFPAQPGTGDSVTVTLRVTPGRFGLTVLAAPRLPENATITFSYAIHFQAPPDVPSPSYPTVARYADWMAIGRVLDDGRVQLLESSRPGGDLLRARLASAGEYLIAAPVTPP